MHFYLHFLSLTFACFQVQVDFEGNPIAKETPTSIGDPSSKVISSMPTSPKSSTKKPTNEEEQDTIDSDSEKTLAERLQEETHSDAGGYERQTIDEFDTDMEEHSDNTSPVRPVPTAENKDDDATMDDKVEDVNEEKTAEEDDQMKDQDAGIGESNEGKPVEEEDQSKQQDAGLTSGRSAQPNSAQPKGTSPSTGSTSLSREELESLKVKKPLDYLKAMLSARHNFQDSSYSSSTTSGATSTMPSLDTIMTEIKTKILGVDLFKVLGENPTAQFDLKKILKQVNVLEASADESRLVMDLTHMIDMVSADLLRQKEFSQQISKKSETQIAEWDAVAASTDKVSELQRLSEVYSKDVADCDINIKNWEKQIANLQLKISQEKQRKANLQQPKQDEIDEELKVGLHHAERAQQLIQEIDSLSHNKSLCECRLQVQKVKFEELKEFFLKD